MDPETGAFIYDYVGADGSSKYEIRYPDGYVVGNFSFINAEGTRETRWEEGSKVGTREARWARGKQGGHEGNKVDNFSLKES